MSKSVYNKIVRSERAQLQNINDLNDITISNPVDGQVLKYSGGEFVNSDYFVEDLKNVVGTPIENQTLKYEATGAWTPSNFIKSVSNSGTGSSLINTNVNGDLFLKSVSAGSGISIDETANSITINGTGAVTSVFGRVGTVTAQSNDYLISQITNASVLSDTNNIGISFPSNQQLLAFNGGSNKWQNINNYNYKNSYNFTGASINANFDSIYSGSNSTFVLPIPTLSDINKRILFTAANSTNVTVSFPSGAFLDTATNFITISSFGSLELIVSSATQYQILSVYGNWSNITAGGKAFQKKILNDLNDVVLSSVLPNQIIAYDGSNWVNSYPVSYYFYNSNGNLNNGGAFLLVNGQTGQFTRAAQMAPDAFYVEKILVKLENPPGLGKSRTFTAYINNVATSMAVTISDNDTISETTINNIQGVTNDLFAIRHSRIGASASEANVTVVYRRP